LTIEKIASPQPNSAPPRTNTAIINTPVIVPKILGLPNRIMVPPSSTAVRPSRNNDCAIDGCPDASCTARSIPANPEHTAENTQTPKVIDDVGIPASSAAFLFADMANKALPEWGIDKFVVRQFIGSMANPVLNTSESCTTEIARKLSGYCINLNAPAVCTNEKLAKALRDEPIIKAQLSALSSCNKSIFSVSPCTQDTQAIHFKVATLKDIKEYKSKGAVGIVVGRFVNAQGQAVIGNLDARLFGADHDTILSTEGLLVVNGIEKHEATHATLVGRYANRMVLDAILAEALLEDG